MSSIKEQVVEKLHKPTRINFKCGRVLDWYRYTLVVIYVFSKLFSTQPVKQKASKDLA